MYLSKDYQDKVAALWEKYINNDEPMPETPPDDIRPEIFESWRRSKEHSVSHLEVKNKVLDESGLSRLIKHNKSLIAVAHPYIQNLYKYLKGSNFLIALTDNHGYVIDLIGVEGMIEKRAQQTSLILGCNRLEEYAGTCGIGLCLAEKEPVQVWGYEHFIEPHHNYVCTAAPIKNGEGEVIATVDVVGPGNQISEHTLAMVCAVVDGIEKEMEMKDAYEKIYVMNNQLHSTLESIASGIIVFDNLGIITQFNKKSLNILKLPFDDIIGQNIANLIDIESSTVDIFSLNNELPVKEISISNSMGIRLHLSVSASIVYNNQNKKNSTVLFMDEQQRVNKLVTKLSGFTAKYDFDSIIGESDEMKKVKEVGYKASQNDSNVLILGESGTGKDLLAQAIHRASDRSSGPFIPINCGSLPKGLVESELFGYESGAFTGANKDGNPGKFELADGGTIFLDEIGDMPLETQASLLRIIQNKEIVRIGGTKAKTIDVRIIAATNSDLVEKVQEKKFRNDLFFRLNVMTITTPPLRDRITDLPILANNFLENYNVKMNANIIGISDEAIEIMKNYSWPGNVRELENIVERAINVASGEFITKKELPEQIISDSFYEQSEDTVPEIDKKLVPIKKEYHRIIEALQNSRGNVQKASDELGIPKRTLYRRIDKYGIDLDDLRLL